MGKANAIGKLLESIGRSFGRRFPQPPPIALPAPSPAPAPVPDIPAPTHRETGAASEQGSTASAATEQACANCPNCPPRQMGVLTPHYYGAVGAASKRGYFYRNYVCPWHNHNPATNSIGEWAYSGVDFDALHPAECLLIETKHGYDNFLAQPDWAPGTRPVPQPWAKNAFATMIAQAGRQHAVVTPNHPEVRLKWAFSASITSVYVYQIFLNSGWWRIEREYRPFTA